MLKSVGAQLTQAEVISARCCFDSSPQGKFGSEVSNHESDTGDDDGEQTIVDNHIGPYRKIAAAKQQAKRAASLEALVLAFDAVQTIKPQCFASY
jgi:hypothetical protein